MHTVELVELALAAATRLGYKIRHDSLGEVAAGPCLLMGQKWIFFDLSDSPADQLAVLTDVLRNDPGVNSLDIPPSLASHLDLRRSA